MELLNSENYVTRFEIQIRNIKKSLKDLCQDPISLISYFDRLELFDFNGDEVSGVLQLLYKCGNRKFQKELQKFKNTDLLGKIKDKYVEQVTEWFAYEEPF
jgi:hypothetical protein